MCVIDVYYVEYALNPSPSLCALRRLRALTRTAVDNRQSS